MNTKLLCLFNATRQVSQKQYNDNNTTNLMDIARKILVRSNLTLLNTCILFPILNIKMNPANITKLSHKR